MDGRVKYPLVTSGGSTTSTGSSHGSTGSTSSSHQDLITSNNETIQETHPIPLSHHQVAQQKQLQLQQQQQQQQQTSNNNNNNNNKTNSGAIGTHEHQTNQAVLASLMASKQNDQLPYSNNNNNNSNSISGQQVEIGHPTALPQMQQQPNSTDSSSSTISSSTSNSNYLPQQDFARMQKIIKKKAMDQLPSIPSNFTDYIGKPRHKAMLFDYIFITLGLISSDSHTLQAEKALKKNHEEFEQDPMNMKSTTIGAASMSSTSSFSVANNNNATGPHLANKGSSSISGGLTGISKTGTISTISASAFGSLGGGLRKLKGNNQNNDKHLAQDKTEIVDDLGDDTSLGERDDKSIDSQSKLINREYYYGSRVFSMLRHAYCRLVCLFLWSAVFRLAAALFIASERSILVLDYHYLGNDRIYYLIPAFCISIQAAAISLVFIRNGSETNWLVPFYSSKDYLIQAKNAFKPSASEYTSRININVSIATVLSIVVTGSLGSYIYFTMDNIDYKSEYIRQHDQLYIILWAIYNLAWAFYSTFTCVFVSFYFNVICSVMKARFHKIARIIENLAESETTKSSNQSRKITTLYLEHNEACELLDESNDFWQYLIFFTYFTYIPGHCYCLYNLFFVDFSFWHQFVTWTIYLYSGFIISLNSFSAAGVSTEAHAPYTSLHTLSLIQLPVDVEVNISTFLHRVRGLTIGYSCYDLFAVTNASMSNTAAACASYFLIVADFSRSSMFNGKQASNLTSNAAAAATAAVNKLGEVAAASGAITTTS